MSIRKARVTCIDLPDDEVWNTVPRADVATEAFDQQRQKGMEKFRKAWWLTQQRWKTDARMAYIGASRVAEVGKHDRALIASVLQHFRDPISFLYEVAALVDEIVVTEPLIARVEKRGGADFLPAPDNDVVGSWWLLSSSLVAQVLATANFDRVDHYEQNYVLQSSPPQEKAFYTSVFRKRANSERKAPRIRRFKEESSGT